MLLDLRFQIDQPIEFTPGATIPIRPVYRANPAETKNNSKANGGAHGERVCMRKLEPMFCSGFISAKEGWELGACMWTVGPSTKSL